MKVYIQWSRKDPEDWVGVEHTDMGGLTKNAEPTAVHDSNNDGWVQALNVQGVVFENWDHYGIRPVVVGIEPGLEVHVWNDDEEDGLDRRAQVWTFLDPAPDPSLDGIMNTRQTIKVYGNSEYRAAWEGTLNVTTHPFSEFDATGGGLSHVWFGVWTTDDAYALGQEVRTDHRWEEWVTP